MADKKISQLTELTSADPAVDVLPLVDSDLNQTKKIKLSNLPLSDAEKVSIVPLTTDFQNGVIQTRNLTTITSSDGYSYTGQPSSIYIGSNVTTIGSLAFSFAPFTSIIIPDSVTSIGSYAFVGTSLTSIIIPNSVTSIGDGAFQFCTSLTSITIPDSLTSIGSSAFRGCIRLTSIIIPDSVTSIGSSAFQNCTGLTSVTLPTNINFTTISDSAFQSSGLTSIIIPDSVTSIGSSAFYQCPLNSVTIGNSVEIISNGVFASCTDLPSVTIPDSVTSIGSYAFQFCNILTSINCLATTAPTLGSSPFDGVATSDIHVPVGATGYGTTYGGLTVFFDL